MKEIDLYVKRDLKMTSALLKKARKRRLLMKQITLKEFFEMDKACIYCKNETEANKLLKAFDKMGKTWCTGVSYLSCNNWSSYPNGLCYDTCGCATTINYYLRANYDIYSFDRIDLHSEPNGLVYISGAISDIDNATELFAEAEDNLCKLGYDVINPCKVCENMDKFDYADYIMASLMALKKCDYICFLDNAEQSDGATIERLVAKRLGIKELKI